MKKIGILTYHSVYNFGANLQALSTLCYFRNHGYDVKIINWRPRDLLKNYAESTPVKQAKVHETFYECFFDLTEICYTDEDIVRVIEKESMDAIVIGSDAVCRHFPFLVRWRPSRTYKFLKNGLFSPDIFPNPYWGSFYTRLDKKIPMILMSVSSQGTLYQYTLWRERKQLLKAINNFSFITVRDSWTQKVFKCFSYGKLLPNITPDPVLGFNVNVSQEIVSENIIKRFNLPEKYIILSFKRKYAPSEDWIKKFFYCCNEKGLAVISLPYPQEENSLNVDVNISLPISPIEWYNIIKYSVGYVGNNMHPIIVSIHNAVPFFSFDYYGYTKLVTRKVCLECSKIYDLCQKFDLLDYYSNVQMRNYQFPNPEVVFDRIYNFDKEKAIFLAKKRVNDYKDLMCDIEKVINE